MDRKGTSRSLRRDRALWGDIGGVYGGIAGLGLYLGVVGAILWP